MGLSIHEAGLPGHALHRETASQQAEAMNGKLAVLRRNHCFGALSHRILVRLAQAARFQSIKRGAMIERKGACASNIIIVADGIVCVRTSSSEGQEFGLSMMELNDVLNLTEVLDGKPLIRDSVAYTDCRLLLIGRGDFLGIVRDFPSMHAHISLVLCERIRAAHRIIDGLAFCSVRQRLAHVLWILSRNGQPAISANATIALTQDEVASLVGASRHAVNRELKKMESEGIVQVRYSTVSLPDPMKLRMLLFAA